LNWADIAELNNYSDSKFRSNINRYCYTTNEQGSTVLVTDKNRNIRNEYYYDAFGCVLESQEEVHIGITYTGQYYLRARYYNRVIGRFSQEDIYRGDGLNLYAYCENNPVRYYDPSGYSSINKERQLALPSGKIPLGLPAPRESSFNIGDIMVSRQVYENYIKG
jgi:RHS repeat-associated protein